MWILGLILLLSPLSLPAQEWRPACRFFCGFDMRRVARLGDEEGYVGAETRITRIGPYYYVADQDTESSVQVFHPDSGFVGRIGRAGQGPEEFGFVGDLDVDSLGNLWVLNGGNQRIAVGATDGAQSEFLTTFRLPPGRPAMYGLEVLPGGRFLLNGTIASAEHRGMWTHLVDPDRGVVWSLEDADATQDGLRPQRRSYALDARRGAVWVAWRTDEYRLESRALGDGELLEVLEPARSWFDDHREARPVGSDGDPHTGRWLDAAQIRAIYLDGDHLWVLGLYQVLHRGRTELRQVLDVFDMRRGILLFTKDLDYRRGSYFVQFDDDGRLVEFVFEEPSDVRIDLWHVSLGGDG